jgi:hypothetical protein
MFVSCALFVLWGRGLCDGPIPRPEEFYRLWCVSECDCEAFITRTPWPPGGCCAAGEKNEAAGVKYLYRWTHCPGYVGWTYIYVYI